SLYDWEWKEAEAHYVHAIELNPSYAAAHHWYSVDYLGLLARFEEAEREMRIARQLDPLSYLYVECEGYLHLLQRRYETAAAHYQGMKSMAPNFHRVYTSLGRSYGFMGRYEEAFVEFQHALTIAGELPSIYGAYGQNLAMAGKTDEARRLLIRLRELELVRTVAPTS